MAVLTAGRRQTGAYYDAVNEAAAIRSLTETRRIDWGSGTDHGKLDAYLEDLLRSYTSFEVAKAAPDIDQIARDEEGNQTYNFTTEINAAQVFMLAIRDIIVGAAPQDADGYMRVFQYNLNGSKDWRDYTSGQLTAAGLFTQMDSLIAAIEDPSS